MESEFLLHGFADFELLHLAGNGHGKRGHEAQVARNFVVRDVPSAKRANVLVRWRHAGLGDDPGAQFFAVLRVGHADHLHVLHLRMAVEKFLDLARVDVLAAANHHVFDAADDVHITFRIHHRQVAGMHPTFGVDGLMRLLGVAPVAVHHRIALGAKLAGFAGRDSFAALRIDDLHLQMRLHLPHRTHPLVQRRVGGALAAHRRGLGHAVGDGDLRQMHVAHHSLHHLDGARAAGHDAGTQGAQIELGKARMIEHGDEHGRHTVQPGAGFVLHALQSQQWVEAVVGIDDGGAVRQTRQVAQHHAEAVVQRHRNAQPVFGGELHRLTNKETVVQDVAVRERGALGKTGGAAGELDVDGFVRVQRCRGLGDRRVVGAAAGDPVGKAQHAGFIGLAQMHHQFEIGQTRGAQFARRAGIQLRREFTQHGEVVAGLERGHGDQRLARHLVERVLHLGGAIGRVDVHQNQADLGRRQLHQHPFHAVVRPDAHAVALAQTAAQQGAAQTIHLALELGIAQANVLVARNQRLLQALALGHGVEKIAYGLRQQRLVGGAAGISLDQRGWFGHDDSPVFIFGDFKTRRSAANARAAAAGLRPRRVDRPPP